MKKMTWLMTGLMAMGLLSARLQADDKKYTLQDLQALEKRKSWEELFAHMEDVSPAQRDASWDQVVVTACLQEEFVQDYTEDWCRTQLKSIVAASQDSDLAWKSGKWVRLHSKHWAAIPFFNKAIQKANDPRCKDEDVGMAVVSGLGLPTEESADYVHQSQALAFDKCWSALKPTLLKALPDGGGYYRDNACSQLKKKGALSGDDAKTCAQGS